MRVIKPQCGIVDRYLTYSTAIYHYYSHLGLWLVREHVHTQNETAVNSCQLLVLKQGTGIYTSPGCRENNSMRAHCGQ
jgi:hypothetical protein